MTYLIPTIEMITNNKDYQDMYWYMRDPHNLFARLKPIQSGPWLGVIIICSSSLHVNLPPVHIQPIITTGLTKEVHQLL